MVTFSLLLFQKKNVPYYTVNPSGYLFKEFSGPSGLSSTDGSMGITWGDYNNDQMMDLYVSNYTGEADLLLTMVDNTSSNDG